MGKKLSQRSKLEISAAIDFCRNWIQQISRSCNFRSWHPIGMITSSAYSHICPLQVLLEGLLPNSTCKGFKFELKVGPTKILQCISTCQLWNQPTSRAYISWSRGPIEELPSAMDSLMIVLQVIQATRHLNLEESFQIWAPKWLLDKSTSN